MQQCRRTYFETMAACFLYNPVYRYIDVAIHQNLETKGQEPISGMGNLSKCMTFTRGHQFSQGPVFRKPISA